jgi:peptidoglycan/LPS O-acetylase OafA/YrhL
MLSRILAVAPQGLRRPTSGGPYLPEIDGLRFLAISAVLLVHLLGYIFAQRDASASPADGWIHHYYEVLARGVELFFVISGFVIAAPFARHYRRHAPAVKVREFYRRRLARLEPPFVLAMLITYAALVLIHGADAKPLLAHLLATCTYSHGLIYHAKSTVAFISWSLEIEVQFYLLAPVLLKLLQLPATGVRSSLLLLAILCVALDRGLAARPALSRITLFHYLPLFLAGCLVSDAAVSCGYWVSARHRLWDAIGACAFAGALYVPPGWTVWALPWLFGLCVVCAFRGLVLSRLLSNVWLSSIGGMCYSIYLVHEPLIYFFGRVTSKMTSFHSISRYAPAQALLLGIPVVACSAVYFLMVEKPCMNKHWPRHLQLYLTAQLRSVKDRIA